MYLNISNYLKIDAKIYNQVQITKNMTSTYYNSIAKGYNDLYKKEQLKKLDLIYSEIKNLNINLDKIKTILDVGCGTGVSSDFFSEKGFEVIGIDPSENLIKENKKGISKLIKASAEEIPFEDKSFDLIISLTAIQNFSDLEKGLKEIKRVGKNKFILTFLNNVKQTDLINKTIKEIFDVKKEIISKDRIYFIY